MLTLSEKVDMFFKMLPYAALYITWLIMYCKYEERKDARKDAESNE